MKTLWLDLVVRISMNAQTLLVFVGLMLIATMILATIIVTVTMVLKTTWLELDAAMLMNVLPVTIGKQTSVGLTEIQSVSILWAAMIVNVQMAITLILMMDATT